MNIRHTQAFFSSEEKTGIEGLPYELFIKILSFFSLADKPVISRVSIQWNITTQSAALKYLIMNTVELTKKYENNSRVDWIKIYHNLIEHSVKYKNYEKEKIQVREIEKQLQEHRRLAAAASAAGIEYSGFGIVRRDTCLTGCGSGALGALLCFLPAYFLCKEMTCALYCSSGSGYFFGHITGFWGRSKCIEYDARKFRQNEVRRQAELGIPLLDEENLEEKTHIRPK